MQQMDARRPGRDICCKTCLENGVEFKAILSMLAPDNIDKLPGKVLDVGICDIKTLSGLVDQLFDKATMASEPHLCDLYAQMCNLLQRRLPEFENAGSSDIRGSKTSKISFRRLLLNKCQEEFEKGEAAMQAMAERENEACEQHGPGINGEEVDEDREHYEAEGFVLVSSSASSAHEDRSAVIADRAAAESERKARRRMLGNIQFIGHLYRYSMLTDNIIHSCIQQLMLDEEIPKDEDLECLCKLLSTVGAQLENPQPKPYSKQDPRVLQDVATRQMDAYMQRIGRLALNKALNNSMRRMLLDIIVQRQNGGRCKMRQRAESTHRGGMAPKMTASAAGVAGAAGALAHGV